MSCPSCNNINCQSTPTYRRQAPSPIGNSCASACNCQPDIVGTRNIIDSHEVHDRQARAVFFLEGGCDVIDKGYIPSSYNLSSNGPKYQKICCNESGQNLESEGMDCLNFVFNQAKAGQSF